MKAFVCLLAICMSVAYCDAKTPWTPELHETHGSTKEYGKEKEHVHEIKDKSHGYDGDSHKKAYGSETQYGKESKYGHESQDKSHSQGDYGYGHDSYHTDKSRGDHGSYGSGHGSYGKDVSRDDHGVEYTKQHTYRGKYTGHCGQDGFYYGDHGSFVICSNSNAYVQPCAPGSRNSGLDNYNYGNNYSYRDFCDINLVDHGYGVKDTHGYGYHDDRDNHAYGPSHRSYGQYL